MTSELLATLLLVVTVCTRTFGNPLNYEDRWWESPLVQWGEAVGSGAVGSIPELIAPGLHIPRLIILIRIYGCRHYPDDNGDHDSDSNEGDSTPEGIITEAPSTEGTVFRKNPEHGDSGMDAARESTRTFRPPRYMPKVDKDRGMAPVRASRYR